VSQYPRELPPFPPLFEYPLFSPPIEIHGELVYDSRHTAAFYLLQACCGTPRAVFLTLELLIEAHPDLDSIQLLERCVQDDRAAILQAIALMSLALEDRFHAKATDLDNSTF
jgi:hypothetical protein